MSGLPIHTLGSLAARVGGRVSGSADVSIRGIDTLETANGDQITLIADTVHARRWPRSKAAAAIVTEGLEIDQADGRPLIFVENAELASIVVLELFRPEDILPGIGIDERAWVHPDAEIPADCRIGPFVSVERGCVLGAGVVLHPGVRLYADVTIGGGSVLHANTVIRERCRLGRNVICHQNVSIGADGFGYRVAGGGTHHVKVPHIGTVVIEDDVEIGAGSCIDRGKFTETFIGEGTKIDDMVMIAHNCRIGRHCLIAGCSGIAGSCVLGDRVVIGGGVGVSDHRRIGAGARLGARSGVTRDVPAGGVYLGYPADEYRSVLRQWSLTRKLPNLVSRIRFDPGRVPRNSGAAEIE